MRYLRNQTMTAVRLNNGIEIQAAAIVCSDHMQTIHIYSDQLTMAQACELFDNSENTKKIWVIQNDKAERVYEGYTELYAVQKGRAIEGEGMILIWLEPPNMEPDARLKGLMKNYMTNINER